MAHIVGIVRMFQNLYTDFVCKFHCFFNIMKKKKNEICGMYKSEKHFVNN